MLKVSDPKHPWLGWVRSIVYRVGLRPKYPSIFYSPSLTVLYSFKKVDIIAAANSALVSRKEEFEALQCDFCGAIGNEPCYDLERPFLGGWGKRKRLADRIHVARQMAYCRLMMADLTDEVKKYNESVQLQMDFDSMANERRKDAKSRRKIG